MSEEALHDLLEGYETQHNGEKAFVTLTQEEYDYIGEKQRKPKAIIFSETFRGTMIGALLGFGAGVVIRAAGAPPMVHWMVGVGVGLLIDSFVSMNNIKDGLNEQRAIQHMLITKERTKNGSGIVRKLFEREWKNRLNADTPTP